MNVMCRAMRGLTLDPVATDWTEEVGIQAVGFFNLVQQFPDVHHLQRHHSTNEYHKAKALPWYHTFNSLYCITASRLKSILQRNCANKKSGLIVNRSHTFSKLLVK